MKLRRWIAVLLALALLAALSCRSRNAADTEIKTEAAKPQAETAKASNVLQLSPDSARYAQLKFAEVIEEALAASIEVTGRVTVNEDRTVRVGSLFTGRIVEVAVKVGDRVGRGQAMAKMHTHEVHEAQSEYAKAQSELSQRKTEAARADRGQQPFTNHADSASHHLAYPSTSSGIAVVQGRGHNRRWLRQIHPSHSERWPVSGNHSPCAVSGVARRQGARTPGRRRSEEAWR